MLQLKNNYTYLTIITLFSAFFIRLAVSGQFQLVPDEANYWQWSRYLALGYHDHPPLLAWAIWLSTKIFGHTEFAVRLPTVIGSVIFSFYLSLLAARLFSWRCAFHTCLAAQLILVINGAALIATPDGMLLPCWAAAAYHAFRAVSENNRSHWLLTGAWFGLGMLSKYTMLIFLMSLFFYMLTNKRYSKQFLTKWPWIGLLLSSLIFSPVLIWNGQNEWATFRHVLYQGGVENKEFITFNYIGDFLGSQCILLSPFLFILLIGIWFNIPKIKRWYLNTEFPNTISYLLWMSLPGFLLFLLLSLHVRIYGNWPAPVYTTAILLVCAFYAPIKIKERVTGLWKTCLITTAMITLPIVIQVMYPILPLSIELDRTARETAGWDQLGKKIAQEKSTMTLPDNTFIFGMRYQYASELAFYTPGQPRTVSINKWARPNVYDFWFDDKIVIGKDGIGIFTYKGLEKRLVTLFEKSDPVQSFTLTRESPWYGTQEVQTVYIFRGYNFKGGLRWQPRNPNDIRTTSKESTSNSL